MSTKATIVKGNLVVEIDVTDLFDSVPTGERDDLMQRIACEDAVIRHVMDQVLTGMTANCSSGRSSTAWQPADGYPTALEQARENLFRFAEKATQEYLERLRSAYRHQRQSETRRLGESRQRDDQMRDQIQALRRELYDTAKSRDYWQDFASRINAERPAAPTGATT